MKQKHIDYSELYGTEIKTLGARFNVDELGFVHDEDDKFVAHIEECVEVARLLSDLWEVTRDIVIDPSTLLT